MPSSNKHIAIYLNNTDRSAFSDRFENDGEKTATLLRQIRPDWRYQIFDCVMGEFASDPTVFDGVILTGSVASVNDDTSWIENLLHQISLMIEAKTPLIGLCFGHQAIAKLLGGTVGRGKVWEFGANTINIANKKPWMAPAVDELTLYCGNNEQVQELPEKMELLGGNSICPNALTVVGNHVMTTQYHPEMNDVFIKALIEEYAETLGTEVAENARATIVNGADGETFAKWMVNFLELDRA